MAVKSDSSVILEEEEGVSETKETMATLEDCIAAEELDYGMCAFKRRPCIIKLIYQKAAANYSK